MTFINIKNLFSKSSIHRNKTVLAVGSLTLDDIGSHTDLNNLDSKIRADSAALDLGGGALNYGLALQAAAKAYDTPVNLQIITKKGKPAPANDNSLVERLQARTQKHVHSIVDDVLTEERISLVDTVKGMPNAIPLNRVLEHNNGRLISMTFKRSGQALSADAIKRIENAAAKADLVFVHTRYPEESLVAATAAKAAGIPVLLDYSVTKEDWDKDPQRQVTYASLVKNSTYIVGSADTVIGSDMTPDDDNLQDNAIDLIKRIHTLGVEHIAISDGIKPVMIKSNDKDYQLHIAKDDTGAKKYTLGIGDTRNAGTSVALLQGKGFTDAIAMGSAIASYKVAHPGRSWIDSFEPKDTQGKNLLYHAHNDDLNTDNTLDLES